MGHDREKVYVRYNPDDLKEVRVYDENDRFLCTAPQAPVSSYFASKDEVAESMREIRTLERTVRGYKKQKGIEADDALALIMREAEARMSAGERFDPKIITPIRAVDEDAGSVAAAVGSSAEPIDWTAALERMEKARELLKGTNMKISDICEQVGYGSVSYFCRSFRNEYGVTPEQYRR